MNPDLELERTNPSLAPQGLSSALAASLVAALAELDVVETGRTAQIPTKNGGSYSYKYADLADVVKLTRAALAKHGLVALTPVHGHADGLACTVTILHESGERLDFPPLPFPHGDTAQATGSAITYHRRYSLVAALGMAAGDDDDGASAQARSEPLPSPMATEDQLMSIEAWIHTASESQQEDLKKWWKTQRIPPLERLTADQADRVLKHIASVEVVGSVDAGPQQLSTEPTKPEDAK